MIRATPNDRNLVIDHVMPLAVLDTPNALIHAYTLRDLPLEESQRTVVRLQERQEDERGGNGSRAAMLYDHQLRPFSGWWR